MTPLTKDQIRDKLQAISSNRQVEQPSEEALDEAFITLVYDAHMPTCHERGEDYDNEYSYEIGVEDGRIAYSRWVLESFFGINTDLLKELLA